LWKSKSRIYSHIDQRQSARRDDTGSQQRSFDLKIVRLFGQQPIKVKSKRDRREHKKERHVSKLIQPQKQNEPRNQSRLHRTRSSEAQLERNKHHNVYDARNAPRQGYIPKIRPPLGDVRLRKVAQYGRQALIDMPAEGINKRRDKATAPHQTIDSKIHPIALEQRHAAKNADNKQTKQKSAMQISPQDHDCGQQKNTLRSFQTFAVEYYGKQHRRNVWRSGEIDIRVRRRKSGIKQTRGQNGNADRNRGGAVA
jgi:hypothetical protein